MLELTLADGGTLDIVPEAVILFEEMIESTNPAFPNAKSIVTYQIGETIRAAITTVRHDDLITELELDNRKGWLRLTRKADDTRLALPVHLVIERASLDEGCEISYRLGSKIITITVNESRREIKKWSE